MNHPLFQNRKFALIYSIGWVLIMGVHFSLLVGFYTLSPMQGFIDSFFFNFFFFLISISIWYIIAFSKNIRTFSLNGIINYVSTMVLMLLMWYGLSSTITKLIVNDVDYQLFLHRGLPLRLISGVMFYVLLSLMYFLMIYYNDLQEKLTSEAKLKSLVKETELNMLKSQIRPHFLFNSLNSVSSLVATDAKAAREMVIKLSDFLRYTVSLQDKEFSTFSEEIENINRYLAIEKTRFGEKLEYVFDVPEDCLSQMIPVMILQPLFENAIKHGVYESTSTINIATKCEKQESSLKLIIRNNFEQDSAVGKGEGVGLNNIKDRLRLLYKSNDLLKTKVVEDEFIVELTIPFVKKTE